MVNKSKAAGTKFETWLVNYWTDRFHTAWRLAEKGSNDEGDIQIQDRTERGLNGDFIIEAKARSNLNVHQTLAQAKAKTQSENVAVVWKKLTRKDGNTRRTPDGEPVIVAMSLETFTRLIS